MGSIDWNLFEDRTDRHCPGFGWIKSHSYKENELCVCYCCRLSLGTFSCSYEENFALLFLTRVNGKDSLILFQPH